MKNNNIHIGRLIIKASILFIIMNFGFIVLAQVPYGNLTLYNHLIPGRIRLPFGENPAKSYNLTINNIDAMVNSHIIAGPKRDDEYRVGIIGDFSVWGFLQRPEDTLSSRLQDMVDYSCEGGSILFYNLGYPSLSTLKDLLIIDKVKKFNPDMIIWMVTLESLPRKIQMETPLVRSNPLLVNRVLNEYQIDLPEIEVNPLDYSIIGQKRNVADLVRYQLYGFLWAATGIDQEYPEEYNTAQRDFNEDESYKDFHKYQLKDEDLSMDIIFKTVDRLGGIEFIIINEPILISNGRNSHIRYNYYYPRWAYDQYREIISRVMAESGIKYYDLWDIVPESEFTNSAIHLSEKGQKILAGNVNQILETQCRQKETK